MKKTNPNWSSKEDDIIIKHVADKQHKNKAEAFIAASAEIIKIIGTDRSSGACSQRYSKAELGKKKASTGLVTITQPSKGVQKVSMAYIVAERVVEKLSSNERLALIDKILNDEL